MPNYCTSSQVASFLQVPSFSGSTTPSGGHVDDFIDMSEARVDELTNHAWATARAGTVTNERARIQLVRSNVINSRGRIQLEHYPIIGLASGTDALNVWDGSAYTEYVANKTGTNTVTDSVNKDWWVDTERGIVYINNYATLNMMNSSPQGVDAYVTYRYATASTPDDIKLATIYFTAAMIAMNDDLNLMQEGDDSMDNAARSQRFEEMAMKVLKDGGRLDRGMAMARAVGGFGVGRTALDNVY
tara:strand:- start:1 stop:732 length:732 start_codon:yes stop_codon:yes gene_type:complete